MDDKFHSLVKFIIKIAAVLVTLFAVIWIFETYTETVDLPGKVTSGIKH